jgi:hypothetical protein
MEAPEIKGRNQVQEQSNLPVIGEINLQQSISVSGAFDMNSLQNIETNLLGQFQRELAYKVWNNEIKETTAHANVTVTPPPKKDEYKAKYSFYEN